MMTQDEMRIVIAEKCGWKYEYSGASKELRYWRLPHFSPLQEVTWHELPDYPNDLNAIHCAEDVLTQEQQEKYAHELSQIVPQNFNAGPIDEGGPDLMCHRDWDVLHATASQRTEAFCRVFWPERFEK